MNSDGIETGVPVADLMARLGQWFGLGHQVAREEFTAPGDYFLRMEFRQGSDGRQFLRLFEGGKILAGCSDRGEKP
jgi:hypothetical protein